MFACRRGNTLSSETQTLLSTATSTNSSGGHQDIPKPAERYNLSSVSLVCPGVSSQMDMPETPPQGEVLEAS